MHGVVLLRYIKRWPQCRVYEIGDGVPNSLLLCSIFVFACAGCELPVPMTDGYSVAVASGCDTQRLADECTGLTCSDGYHYKDGRNVGIACPARDTNVFDLTNCVEGLFTFFFISSMDLLQALP